MALKKRSPRRKVRLHCRLRDEGSWIDVQIQDLSESGLMAECDSPPPRGTYIEIRRYKHVLIGVVIWSSGNRFGVSLAEKTDVEAIIEGTILPLTGQRRDLNTRPRAQRTLILTTPSDWRWLGHAMERVSLLATGALAAAVVGVLVYEGLSIPLAQVADHLRP